MANGCLCPGAFLECLNSSSASYQPREFIPLQIAVLTVSDTLTEADDIYQIRAVVSRWIADAAAQAVITTGVTGHDGTPEAVLPLLDKQLDGFGEVFRMISYQDIKSSTIESRAITDVANDTYIFCLPGSSNTCKTAWDTLSRNNSTPAPAPAIWHN